MFSVNVSPDMGMYTLLINQGYDPTFALCEFIDNAIHAHLESSDNKKIPVTIKVKFYSNEHTDPTLKNSISIEDDGPGIPEELLKSALKPAKPPAKKGISEFGIGMKAAAVWFADEWALDTYPMGTDVKLSSTFNLIELLESGKDTINVNDSKNTDGTRGTRIVLRLLRRDISKERYESICKDLSEIYQRFISGASPRVILVSEFNGTQKNIEFTNEVVAPLVSPKHIKKAGKTYTEGEGIIWRVSVDYLYQGYKVSGFIHLREVGSYINNPGLTLFRYDRVICGTTQNKYIPLKLYKTSNKARGMLVYGELDIDEYPVSYTKDSFSFDDDDFVSSLLENVDGLSDLLTQADHYRKNHSGPAPASPTPATPASPTPATPASPTPATPASLTPATPASLTPATPASPFEIPNTNSNSNGGNFSQTNSITDKEPPVATETPITLDNKPDTKIKSSQEIIKRLNSVSSKKLSQLYNSLCSVSLVNHPALMYVGAWSFFESLSKLTGNNGSNDFPSFFTSKVLAWGFSKDSKSSFSKSLKNISEEGNCVKHCGSYVSVDAKRLANDFVVLEPLIIKILDEINSNSA